MTTSAKERAKDTVLVSHAGVRLPRATTFRFTLDLDSEQAMSCSSHAGASRMAYNHHLARVKANLNQRAAELTYGVEPDDLTPLLSWSRFSLINHMNAWKDGRDPTSPINEDGTRGLSWRTEVSAEVFETASVNAAAALRNWIDSRHSSGARRGFPKFKARHRTVPAFRLRAKYKEGTKPSVRPTGPKTIRFPKLGELRVRESTRRLRRMLGSGRFHVYSATFRHEHGRWSVSISGAAADFHPARHATSVRSGRHQATAGLDLGVTSLVVVADETGALLETHEGVKALQRAQTRLKLANQALARTKRGSNGRRRASIRLSRIHGRIAAQRRAAMHRVTYDLATRYTRLVLEDLNVAGMRKNRSLARHIADAAFGEFRRQMGYKAAWYGLELIIADRWYPSSKTCSGCGQITPELTLRQRVYECCTCGTTIDRDLNAAINLARFGRTNELETARPPRATA